MAIEVMMSFLCIPCDIAVEVFYHRGLCFYTIPGAFHAIQASLRHIVWSGHSELNRDYRAPDAIGCHTPSTL